MKRQLLASLAFTFLWTLNVFADERQWIQVKIYHLNSEAAADLFDETFAEAILPALKRQGIEQVGVFEPVALGEGEGEGEEAPGKRRYVISALESPEQLAVISEKMGADPDFLRDAAAYLSVDKEEAVFSRVESSLLYAFKGMPRLVVPKKETDEPRLFELRIYESYSEAKGKRKVEMFNEGEIEIFNEVGLNCLFFGEAMVGKNLPQLTYLAVYNDEDHRKEVWEKFLMHPAWEELKTMPRYQDTVSKIISQHLKALAYSPIQ